MTATRQWTVFLIGMLAVAGIILFAVTNHLLVSVACSTISGCCIVILFNYSRKRGE